MSIAFAALARFSLVPILITLTPGDMAAAQPRNEPERDYPIRPVPFNAVRAADEFWSPRLERNRTVTARHEIQMCEETGRLENFDVAAKKKPGGMRGLFFNDSDVYKMIEGAAYCLALKRDPELEAQIDSVIARIAAAQEPDGYLYTSRTIMDPKNPPPGGKERWSDIAHGHEMYCVGHLYEAAAAHFEATGKRTLLDVAIRNANLVADVFGPGKNPNPCGHPEIEIGLVKLYRVTGDAKYLDLAKFFIGARGRAEEGRKLFGEYAQDHKPLLEQDTVVGHSVRAAYLYAGMLDVAMLTGQPAYLATAQRLWSDLVGTKMYLTGGIGSHASNEGFGGPYDLPNGSGYNETCAAIANAMWNHRLFLATGDAKHMDVVERVIYNGFLSGWSLSGDRFFYPNPLESAKGAERVPWFDCACCPPNVLRFVPSILGYAYAHRGNDVYVNLFIGGEATLKPGASKAEQRELRISQQSRYPWEGDVKVTVNPVRPSRFTLRLRIPGWARGEVVGSDLYRFADAAAESPSIKVNGSPATLQFDRGYALLDREWKAGDTVDLHLPTPIRRVIAHPNVKDNVGRVALQRGPLVYCVEGRDASDDAVLNLGLADNAPLKAEFRKDLLGGVAVISGKARVGPHSPAGPSKAPEPGASGSGTPADASVAGAKPNPALSAAAPNADYEFSAIPYYGWANQGPRPMAVWLRRDVSAASSDRGSSDR